MQQINTTEVPFDSWSRVFLSFIYCRPISTGVSPPPPPRTITTPPFPFLFLLVLPSERPPIGFGGGRRLCRIIMGSSWENCPRKGLPGKKKGGGGEKFGLVSDPSRKHSSEGAGLFEGTTQSRCRRPKPVVSLRRCQNCQDRGERCTPEGQML